MTLPGFSLGSVFTAGAGASEGSDFVDIMNGPEHAAHRESVMAGFLLSPKHPLTNIEKEYDISENAYGI